MSRVKTNEVCGSELLEDFSVGGEFVAEAGRRDSGYFHAVIAKEVKEILDEGSGIDIAAAEFKSNHADPGGAEHVRGAVQDSEFVAFDIQL